MSSYTDVKDLIISNIKTNGQGEITGQILQDVLLGMLDNSSYVEEITYNDLKVLRNEAKLIPSRLYRITDYITTTTQTDTQSAGHPFDVIVLALSKSELSEQALAIQSTRDTDGYFANSKLSAWKIWYSLDNDTERFVWADATNGKGVIYRMIDEFNNDCPYDFKNIQFHVIGTIVYYYTFSLTSSTISDYSLIGTHCYGNKMGLYVSSEKQTLNCNYFINSSVGSYCHSNTFGNFCHHNTFQDNCYSICFGNDCYNNNFSIDCYSNIFGNACYSNNLNPMCYYNTFGNNCYSNTFGFKCCSISFGNNCYSNTFGSNCYYNSFGNFCHDNSFGDSSYSNSFGNNCMSNSFGNECTYNSFGNSCRSNIFGKGCYTNSFGNSCSSNIFGNYCIYNSFGNSCSSNSFGSSESPGNYFSGNSLGDDVRYISLQNYSDASSNNRVKNYKVVNGTQGQGGSLIIEVERNRSYETTIAIDSEGNVKQFCISDIIS